VLHQRLLRHLLHDGFPPRELAPKLNLNLRSFAYAFVLNCDPSKSPSCQACAEEQSQTVTAADWGFLSSLPADPQEIAVRGFLGTDG
jgi:hypothetical protein